MKSMLFAAVAALGLSAAPVFAAETVTVRCGDESTTARTAKFWIEATLFGAPVRTFIGPHCEEIVDVADLGDLAEANAVQVFAKDYPDAYFEPTTIVILRLEDGSHILVRKDL